MTTPEIPSSALEAAGAVVTETSLGFKNGKVSWESYERLGSFIGQMNRSCAWWVGDLIVYGEEIFGEEHAQIERNLGLAPQTIANRASVARHIPPSRRRASLPFGVHAEVAYLDPKVRDQWLDRAEDGQWTRAKLRLEMRSVKELEIGPDGRSGQSGTALDGDFLSEPESGPRTLQCPACGHEFER